MLPRLHRILTTIYVPDYFIGRTRTGDGLLGDPVNLALMGTGEQICGAMERAGWVKADPITAQSSWAMVASTLQRRSYPEAPVSPLFLFGKQQAFAYQQEVDGNPKQRHHVRFWPCPEGWLLPGGARVDWLAAGTFDTSVGFEVLGFASDGAPWLRAVVFSLGAALLLFQAVLAVLILRGSNWARVLVMFVAVFDIYTTFIAWLTREQELTLSGSIYSLAIDILILLALSSQAAASYARRNDPVE